MKNNRNRKGFAFSMIVVVVISIILIASVWYAGRTVAGGLLQGVSDVLMGMLGKKSITIRDKQTLVDFLRCYTAMNMPNKETVKGYTFPALKGTNFEGCLGYGKGPSEVDFQLDLGDKDYIELGSENEGILELFNDNTIKQRLVVLDFEDLKNAGSGIIDITKSSFLQGIFSGSSLFGPGFPPAIAVSGGDKRKAYKKRKETDIFPGESITPAKIRLYDKSGGKIKTNFKCKKGIGSMFAAGPFFAIKFEENCKAYILILVEDKGIEPKD